MVLYVIERKTGDGWKPWSRAAAGTYRSYDAAEERLNEIKRAYPSISKKDNRIVKKPSPKRRSSSSGFGFPKFNFGF